MKRKKILLVATIFPWPPIGGALSKLFYLLREVNQHHEVDLLLFPREAPTEDQLAELRPHCSKLEVVPFDPRMSKLRLLRYFLGSVPIASRRYLDSPIRQMVEGRLKSGSYDLLHVEGNVAGQSLYDLRFPKLIVPHDAYFRKFQSELPILPLSKQPVYFWEMLKHRRHEPFLYGYFDLASLCTEVDAQALRRLNPRLETGVVSNGVTLAEWVPQPEAEEYPSLAFSGSYAYPPNEEAARILLAEVAPRLRRRYPELTVFIIGDRPTEKLKRLAAKHSRNVITGRVEFVSQWIAKGSVYCSPLQQGTGFKNKVPEAWAMERPLVASPKTMEGIDFIPDRDALVAESTEGLVNACDILLRSKTLRLRLGKAGRRRVEEHYNWRMLAKDLLALYELVLEKHNR